VKWLPTIIIRRRKTEKLDFLSKARWLTEIGTLHPDCSLSGHWNRVLKTETALVKWRYIVTLPGTLKFKIRSPGSLGIRSA
jgi:hypothetical protein